MNCLNRHDSMVYLLNAWNETGNPIYETYYNNLVMDWTSHLPCPNALAPAGKACIPLGGSPTSLPTCEWVLEDPIGAQACKTGTMESPWRSLEMGIRMGGVWPASFFGFQNSSIFSTSSRVMMVLAVAEHNSALAVDGGHPGRGTPNWEMTQWQGLISSCAIFPELKNASGLLTYALQELEAILDAGVYVDGVETEQASGYDMMTANDFYNSLQVLQDAGHAGPPPSFAAKVENMWNYGAMISDPVGCLPRNGDSDLCNTGYNTAVMQYFNRPDWTYVHTNGAEGIIPAAFASDGPSSIFPWAGQIAMRSGYGRNATWVWFDVGPYGSSGHAHRDKLQLTLHSRGSMILVDSGRFAYQGTDLSAILHRAYADNTTAHNTLTIDGCDQLALPPLATAPVDNSTWRFSPANDWAYGSMSLYDGLKGNATHSRSVFYQRCNASVPTCNDPVGDEDGDILVVVDVINTDRARTVQATWHSHPNASGVSVDTTTQIARVGGADGATGVPTTAQVCIASFNAAPNVVPWDDINIVSGRYQNATTGENWQGWYSQAYDDASASRTLVYDAQVPAGKTNFMWAIVPTSYTWDCAGITTQVLSISSKAATVTVQVPGQQLQTITVPMPQA